jgi:hypothetical protein
MPLALTAATISRPAAVVSPSGFSTRMPLSGPFSASSAMGLCEGGQVDTHTTSVGQALNISWCEVKVRMPGYSCFRWAQVSSRRSQMATSSNRSDAASDAMDNPPPHPPPTTLAV